MYIILEQLLHCLGKQTFEIQIFLRIIYVAKWVGRNILKKQNNLKNLSKLAVNGVRFILI